MNTTAVIALAVCAALALFQWWCYRKLLRDTESRRATEAGELGANLDSCRQERNKLLDALSDAFLLVDDSKTIVFANSAARRLFGSRPLLHRGIQEIFLDSRLANAVFKCLQTGSAVTEQVVFSQQTSPRGNLETRGINAWIIDAAQLPDSPITRILIRDVTAEYQTEQIRKDFVANASHELRTPMAIISGYLENLLDEDMLEDPAICRRFLTIMRKHSDRITRIIEDMLVISRLESGEASALKFEPFRFRSCVTDVLERLEPIIQEQKATVLLAIEPEDIAMEGDRFYWTQVLFNLIENALKQNPHPGLRIRVSCQETTHAHLHITVEDNGIGIPTADLPHIFRRFYRVEKHHSQKEIKGTGLGLSIVKRAIVAHHGDITVSSIPGRETKFTILVPIHPPALSHILPEGEA